METWLTTINRLEAAELTTLYPTHFGPIDDVHGHLVALRGLLIDAVAFVAVRQRPTTIKRADGAAWRGCR